MVSSEFKCLPVHPKCKAMCCKLAPIEKEIYERNRDRLVREVLEENEWDGYDPLEKKVKSLVLPFTKDMYCPFLNQDLSCNIYEDRPHVCRTYGDESHHCMQCPYQDKNGRLRSRQETRKILRYEEKVNVKFLKEQSQ